MPDTGGKTWEKTPLIEIRGLRKVYKLGKERVVALDDINLTIQRCEICCILGTSGSGKSTLLNMMAGLERPTKGQVLYSGKDVCRFDERRWALFRQKNIGFVFQFYNLVQNLTALENVELALQICKDPLDAREVLTDVGLQDRMLNFPAQLSGGEQQRVAIARALAKNPKLLLCDEPTGALDYQTGKAILKLLQDTCRQKGMTVVVITHNMAIAPMADQVIRFKNGQVRNITRNSEPTPVEQIEW